MSSLGLHTEGVQTREIPLQVQGAGKGEGVLRNVRDEKRRGVDAPGLGTDSSEESQALEVEITHSGKSWNPTRLV